MSSSDPPLWLRRLGELRHEFQRRADDRPSLRHLVIQPLTPKMRMPATMAAQIEANLNRIRKCEVWDWRESLPELAYLYGPPSEVSAFERLAEQAWLALPLRQDWCPLQDKPSDAWLWLVYELLRNEFPNYFFWDRVLQVVGIPNVPGVEGYIYTFHADQEAEADQPWWQGLPRFRQTCLRVDPFAATATAIAAASENLIQAVLSGQPADAAGDKRAAQPQRDGTAGGEKPARTTWQEVAEYLKRLRDEGKPWTSQHKLAKEMGCSSGTINKAIRKTPELQNWAEQPTATPKAQSLTPWKRGEGHIDVVTDRTPDSRVLDPEDEVAIREFIERADPETKAWFLALKPEDQLAFLVDPGKHQQIRGRKP
jgi:hypothetical protein